MDERRPGNPARTGNAARANPGSHGCACAGYEPLGERIHLPDPNDRHVLAVAITGRADVIVTKNLKDFPADRLARLASGRNILTCSSAACWNCMKPRRLPLLRGTARASAVRRNPWTITLTRCWRRNCRKPLPPFGAIGTISEPTQKNKSRKFLGLCQTRFGARHPSRARISTGADARSCFSSLATIDRRASGSGRCRCNASPIGAVSQASHCSACQSLAARNPTSEDGSMIRLDSDVRSAVSSCYVPNYPTCHRSSAAPSSGGPAPGSQPRRRHAARSAPADRSDRACP